MILRKRPIDEKINKKTMRERKESLQNASLKIDKELRKSKRFSKLYENIFKYGSYVDYVVFASGYVVLTLFVFTVLKTI